MFVFSRKSAAICTLVLQLLPICARADASGLVSVGGKCIVSAVRTLLTEPRGEPPNLEKKFEEIKDLPRFPFEEAGGHWVKTSDGSYIHTWFEPALLPNGTLKMFPSPTAVVLPGLSGRARDTYLSGYVDALRLEGLNVVFVEGNGDGWTELHRRYEAYKNKAPLPDRYNVEDQANNVVEAVDGLQKILRAQGRLAGNTTFNLVGNSYGAWVAQKVASGPHKEFFNKYVLLGPGTESLHRSQPGVRETENFMDCLADLQFCTPLPMRAVSAFLTFPIKFARDYNHELMEAKMDRYLPKFFKSHFPVFKTDSIRLESALKKFKGIWLYDSKKSAKDMRGVTLITARHDSVMPAEQGILVHDELGAALKSSRDYGGHIEIGDADHDFLATGKKDPIYNKTASVVGQVIRGDGVMKEMPADGSKMVIESLSDVTKIRPARTDEIKRRPITLSAQVVESTLMYQPRSQLKEVQEKLDRLRNAWIYGIAPSASESAHH